MKLSVLLTALDAIAPLRMAESWDNVGLLAGDPEQDVRRVLVTIDYTMAVAEEAVRAGCDAVVAYHPPIFKGLTRIAPGTPVAFAARHGVALYSPHTALDAAPGGTNDVLADLVGMDEREPLRVVPPRDEACKLVTFVPHDAVEKVSRAIFDAGAGRIGKYAECSFRAVGKGTFFGEEGARPAVGEAGKREVSDETKIETVVPSGKVAAVVAALRASHPYEEPAFDLVRLAAHPDGAGMGRVGRVAAISRDAMFARIKAGLGIERMLVAGPTTGTVTRCAVAAGAGGELLGAALARGVDLVLTGELRHHDALAAAARGVTVVCALHSQSERVALRALRDALVARIADLEVRLSTEDRDPFVFA